MMERTPLRETFFRLAFENPYLAIVKKMYVRAWVEGYRCALEEYAETIPYKREREETLSFLHSKGYREREEDALTYITESEQRAEELVSLALLGGKLESHV